MDKRLLIFFSLVLVFFFLVLIYMFFFNDKNKEDNLDNYVPFQPIRIKLLNGCGINRLADNVGEVLEKEKNKIYVVETGDVSKWLYKESVIKVNGGNKQQVEWIQSVTDIKNVIITKQKNPQVFFTIILGRDAYKFLDIK